MKRTWYMAVFAAGLLLAGTAPASAQSGLGFKAAAVFNSTQVDEERQDLRLSDAAGWSIGAELVLPMGLGVGISGYTMGSPSDFDFSEGSLVFLADANYFLRLAALPIAPYAGVHVGLGTYRLDDVREGQRPEVDFGDLGFQAGVRLQVLPALGIDAQYRRVSGSLDDQQGTGFEGNQVLLGVVLF